MFSLFLVVLVLLFGEASGLTKEFVLVKTKKNWDEAQQHCIDNYRGLAKIYNEDENQYILDLLGNNEDAWIGLRRGKKKSVEFKLWSDRTLVSFHGWKSDQPNNKDGNQDCVLIGSGGWNDQQCDELFYFVCYYFLAPENMVWVQEKKTWEQALEYCRMNYTDLASPASKMSEAAGMQSGQIDKVWTGLRFLDGTWFWVSREPSEPFIPLPSCPAPHYRCGSLDTQSHQWEIRDCNEKLNFICYN